MQGEVHVWRVVLDRADDIIGRLRSTLSEDERSRGDRFRSAGDRARFLASRAALRAVLAHYCGRPASGLSFLAGPHGKPYLDGAGGVEFNLSHSGDLALVAVATGVRVGVDIERVRELDDRDAIAHRFFSARERAELDAQPQGLRTAAFFRIWSCKEAYIKCLGTGLHEPLDGFSVSADPRAPARLVEIGGDPEAAAWWTMRGLDAGDGYAAAVAVEAAACEPRLFDFAGSAIADLPPDEIRGKDGPQ